MSGVGALEGLTVSWLWFGAEFGHSGVLVLLEALGVVLPGGRGSGRHWDRRSLEEDVGVDDGVGEGVEVGDGSEISLVGDVSSIVLEGGEGTFSHGSSFVGLLEVWRGAIQLEAMVVVEVDDAGASVGLTFSVGTGLSVWFVGTGPFLSAIAFLLIEPTSSGLHFQSSGTEELAVLGVAVLERIVSSGVEGDVGFSLLFGDVFVDIPGIEGGIG